MGEQGDLSEVEIENRKKLAEAIAISTGSTTENITEEAGLRVEEEGSPPCVILPSTEQDLAALHVSRVFHHGALGPLQPLAMRTVLVT